jgi:AmmeMemoRadiSam system protein B
MATTVGPTVAGQWYPEEAHDLAAEVDRLLGEVPSPPPRTSVPPAGVLVPHAGFVYSGAVAAHAFVRLRDAALDRVVLLGPSHYADFAGAGLPRASAWRTPLGAVPFDDDALAALADLPGFSWRHGAYAREHSLEAEIPFLQRTLAPGFRLIPVLLGPGSSPRDLDAVAAGIATVAGGAPVVTSSDLTHYGPRFGYVPFHERVAQRIEALDREALAAIAEGDAAALERCVERTGATICGRHAIGVMLRLLAGRRSRVLAYDTSGRMTGSWDHSVSYAAAAVDAAP